MLSCKHSAHDTYQIKEACTKKKNMNTNIPFLNEILPICLSGKMQSFIAKLQLPRILVSQNKVLQGKGLHVILPNYWVTNTLLKRVKNPESFLYQIRLSKHMHKIL